MRVEPEASSAGPLAGTTGSGVRVAVVDSGRDPSWPEPRIEPGVGMARRERPFAVAPNPDDADRLGHGTACADLILRLAPGVRILPVRIFGDRLETSPQVAAAGILHAARCGARVINLSFGTVEEDALPALHRACEEASRAGSILVAAADLATRLSFPAVFDQVIGVETLPDHGPARAPGDFVYVRRYRNEVRASGRWRIRGLGATFSEVFGSSYAAPPISAVIARCLEAEPGLDLEGVRQRLESLAIGVAPSPDGASSAAESASSACHHS